MADRYISLEDYARIAGLPTSVVRAARARILAGSKPEGVIIGPRGAVLVPSDMAAATLFNGPTMACVRSASAGMVCGTLAIPGQRDQGGEDVEAQETTADQETDDVVEALAGVEDE